MKKFGILTILGITIAGLTSCLKDKVANIDPVGSPATVEFATTTSGDSPVDVGAGYTRYVRSYDISPTAVNMIVYVNYTGSTTAPEDVTVSLGLKPAAITAYNDAMHTTYVELPSNMYTLPASVVIPKGQRKAAVTIKLNTNLFDLSKQYVLPLSITATSSGTVSGNYGTVFYAVGAKNKYDGNYTVTATAPMVDATSSSLTGYYPLNSDLVTTSATQVVMYCYTYLNGLQGHPIKSGTSSSYYGNFAPVFTMADDGTVTSVINYYGQGTNSSVRAARLNPTGVNKFTVSADGLTKTLEVSYIMVQSGADRTSFYEKWTFLHGR